MKNKPNIMLIVVDCLRADRCPATLKNTGLKFWQKMHDTGSCFTQMISSASATPVCFGSLLTGHYSRTHGIKTFTGPAVNRNVPNVATLLKSNGYTTNAWMTGPLIDVLKLNSGFDHYQHREHEDYVYTKWGKNLLKQIKKSNSQSPWFGVLHLWELHMPRRIQGDYSPPTRTERYDLAWKQLDQWLVKIWDCLDKNTIVILTADHGESIITPADRAWTGKIYKRLRRSFNLPKRPVDWKEHGCFVFEELIRIPCAISGYNVQNNIFGNQVRQIDIMPTILELAGIETLPEMDGKSLLGIIKGEQIDDRPAFIESGSTEGVRHWHGLRRPPWKYVERPRNANYLNTSPMLFNFIDDPLEKHNVIKKNKDIAISMRQELDEIIYKNKIATERSGSVLSNDEQKQLETQLKNLGYL